ncbi:MAG: sigma factor, partial [Planctomycetota bacterium]
MAEPAPGTLLSTTTNTDLLRGLKDPQNQTVWQQYVDRYRPLLLGCGRRVGLSHADAEDVAQLTLTAFCTAYQAGKYDRERGRLRDWLFGIMRNQIR